MKTAIIFICALILALLILTFGLGAWYLVGWFLSNEMNPLHWHWFGKLITAVFVLNCVFQAFPQIVDDLFDHFTK